MSQLDARTLGAAVQAHFDTHTLAKGRVYQQQRRVQNCLVTLAEPRGWLIAADVRGSQPTPYGVEIQLSGGDAGNKLEFTIPQGPWPHLGSVFFEVIFVPPPGYERDFPVHSPMREDSVQPGQPVWFAQEGLSRKSLELYQLATAFICERGRGRE